MGLKKKNSGSQGDTRGAFNVGLHLDVDMHVALVSPRNQSGC